MVCISNLPHQIPLWKVEADFCQCSASSSAGARAGRGAVPIPPYLYPKTPLDRSPSRGSTAPKLHWQQRELFSLQCALYRTQISQLLPGVIKQSVIKFAPLFVFWKSLFQLSSLISPKRRKSGENNLYSLLTTSNTFTKMFSRFLSVLGIPLCRS